MLASIKWEKEKEKESQARERGIYICISLARDKSLESY